MNQQFCACCGKGSRKLTDVVEYPRKQPYDGNHVVVLTRHSHPEYHTPYTEYTIWDGESYRRNEYGSFCSRRCAYEFAEAAVRAGFKRVIGD